MWIIFVPGAFLAALLMFRWFRKLVLLLMVGAGLWFYAITQGWVH